MTTAPEPERGRSGPGRGGLAVAVAALQAGGTAVIAWGDDPGLDLGGYALLLGGGLVLGSRDRAPAVVLAAATTVAYHSLGYPFGISVLALLVANAGAIKDGRRRLVWVVGVIAYAAWALLADVTSGQALAVAALGIASWVITEAVAAAVRTISHMLREEERLKDERRRRQTSDERLRIAAELHDVLGHHLSLINVRAGVGRHLMDQRPEEARAALDAIKDASAEALREVRSVLDVLQPGDDSAPRRPAPGLAALGELTGDAGVPVRTTTTGDPFVLPPEVDRAAYRIVQEALTNVRRHAGPAAAVTITITHEPGAVMIEVEDDGGIAGPIMVAPVDGNGLTGMRERATALGGSFSSGPRAHGGWRVRAGLPVPTGEDGPVEEVTPG